MEYMRSPRCEETLVKPPFEYISQLLLISKGIVRIREPTYPNDETMILMMMTMIYLIYFIFFIDPVHIFTTS